MKNKTAIFINGQVGDCGGLRTFLGFAPANLLYAYSIVDILNEDTGEGYQRPRNVAHSREFKDYIHKSKGSTIPLTFNLRGEPGKDWQVDIQNNSTGYARLMLNTDTKPLSQVDCQHRLGELGDSDIPLAFMAFIGLDLRTEMALFNIINSKAKGLSSSLTDYHESNLLKNLADDAPHLYIARRLNDDSGSPWHLLIRYGGETNSGLKRRTSFRMIQKTISRFLNDIDGERLGNVDSIYMLIAEYWWAIRRLFESDWLNHRKSLLTKGIGLYSLMRLLPYLLRSHEYKLQTRDDFYDVLKPLATKIDWSSKGMFAGIGGQAGVHEVLQYLKRELL